MHIVIATVGTRGDVQPFVAVAGSLAARGHRVTFATHDDHRALVESYGHELRSACGNFKELMASEAGRRWLESGDKVAQYLEAFRALFKPRIDAWLADFESALRGADAVIVHGIAAGAMAALQRLKIPYVVVAPYGVVPSGEFDMGLPRIPWLGSVLNRAAHRYFLNQVWALGDEELARYFDTHGVERDGKQLWVRQIERGIGHLHMWSEVLLPTPKDWPACAEVTGYCFLDALPSWKPTDELAAFVAAKPAPIYVGFGSMTGMDPERLAAVTKDALRKSKQRAVVAMGWGGMKGFEPSEDLLVVDDVPHDWLFSRVTAVVHHCGAGTTAAALRAGRPSVGVPFFGDQPFWARLLARLGTSPAPVPKAKLSSERLSSAIVRATSDPKLRENADALGTRIRSESGADRTADRALHHLSRWS